MSSSSICQVCPLLCNLSPDEIGPCRNRINQNGTITPYRYGYCSLLVIDPIEKKPFFHHNPHTKYLSVGLFGCNLNCGFCQNYKISQSPSDDLKSIYYAPWDLVALAKDRQVRGIAFTYSEPTLQYEYILHVADSLVDDLDIVLKTNAFVSPGPWQQLCEKVQAINVDIKGHDDQYAVIGGEFQTVRSNLVQAAVQGVHVEVSLIIQSEMIEDFSLLGKLRDSLTELGSELPIHILYTYPCHLVSTKYDKAKLINVLNFFRERFRRTYISNVHSPEFEIYRQPV